MARYYKKEGPMWDRAFRVFVESVDGYLAAATDLAS